MSRRIMLLSVVVAVVTALSASPAVAQDGGLAGLLRGSLGTVQDELGEAGGLIEDELGEAGGLIEDELGEAGDLITDLLLGTGGEVDTDF